MLISVGLLYSFLFIDRNGETNKEDPRRAFQQLQEKKEMLSYILYYKYLILKLVGFR